MPPSLLKQHQTNLSRNEQTHTFNCPVVKQTIQQDSSVIWDVWDNSLCNLGYLSENFVLSVLSTNKLKDISSALEQID